MNSLLRGHCGTIDEAKQVAVWCVVCAGLIIKKAYRCKQCVGVRRVVEGGQSVICPIDPCLHCFRKATEGLLWQLTALHHDLGHVFQVFDIEDDSRQHSSRCPGRHYYRLRPTCLLRGIQTVTEVIRVSIMPIDRGSSKSRRRGEQDELGKAMRGAGELTISRTSARCLGRGGGFGSWSPR